MGVHNELTFFSFLSPYILYFYSLYISLFFLPFCEVWPDCQGPAGRCDPWLPTKDDLFLHPAAGIVSGGHRLGPREGIYSQPAVILAKNHKEGWISIEKKKPFGLHNTGLGRGNQGDRLGCILLKGVSNCNNFILLLLLYIFFFLQFYTPFILCKNVKKGNN